MRSKLDDLVAVRDCLSEERNGLAEEHAGERHAEQMILWTDTRFKTAHRFYERLGYQSAGRTRAIDDLSRSVEYFYSKRLQPAL